MTALLQERTTSDTCDEPLVALIKEFVTANPGIHASGPLVLQGHMRKDREMKITLLQTYCGLGLISGTSRGVAFTEAAGQCVDFVTDEKDGITRAKLKSQDQVAEVDDIAA